MGIVSGISLFHNQKAEKENDLPYRQLESTPFTIAEFYPLLKSALEKNQNFILKRLSAESLEIEEWVECDIENEENNYELSGDDQGNLVIQSEYFEPLLYKLLAIYTVQGHEVNIEWQGLHPFYNPETISAYKEGHYHYACLLPIEEMNDYISDVINDFKNANDYWELTLFHDQMRIELNNHCSEIYEDEDQPKKVSLGISINELQQELTCVQKATSEGKGDHYFTDLNPNEALQIMKDLKEELEKTGTEQLLAAFNPQCKSYYDIKATISNLSPEKVAELITSSNSYVAGEKVEYTQQQLDNKHIRIDGSYKSKNIGHTAVIKNEDILEGHIYLGKLYDEPLFELLQTLIAQHFCPCFISSGEDEITIYYSNEHDKKRIEESLQEFEGYEDYFKGFIKVNPNKTL